MKGKAHQVRRESIVEVGHAHLDRGRHRGLVRVKEVMARQIGSYVEGQGMLREGSWVGGLSMLSTTCRQASDSSTRPRDFVRSVSIQTAKASGNICASSGKRLSPLRKRRTKGASEMAGNARIDEPLWAAETSGTRTWLGQLIQRTGPSERPSDDGSRRPLHRRPFLQATLSSSSARPGRADRRSKPQGLRWARRGRASSAAVARRR